MDAHAAAMLALQMQNDPELYAGMTEPFDGEDGKKNLDPLGQETKQTRDKKAKQQRKLDMENKGMISRDPWGPEANEIAADESFEEEAGR